MANQYSSMSRVSTNRLLDLYLHAKDTVVSRGFEKEIEWQDGILLSRVSETDFLREAAWVILSSGMREKVIRAKFYEISVAFRYWRSAIEIVQNRNECEDKAFRVYGHTGKISAIIGVAEQLFDESYEKILADIEQQGVDYLERFDFIGPVTKYHLAKNIGLDVVKPDRHLIRIANSIGETPASLCQKISHSTGDRLSVIDLILWRFATLEPFYLEIVCNIVDGRVSNIALS